MSDFPFHRMRMTRLVRPAGTPGLREWAEANGHWIVARGRIPFHVYEAYFAANPEVYEVVRVFAQGSGVGPDVYDWPEDGPLGPIYAIVFVRGLDEHEVLHGLGAEAQDVRLVSDEEVAAYRVTEISGEIVRVARAEDWTVAECKGRRGNWRESVESLSQDGGEAIAVQRDGTAGDSFIHAVNGQVVTSFTPSRPFDRQGSAPDGLNEHLCALGIDPAAGDIIDNAVPAALALASRISGVVIIDTVANVGPEAFAREFRGLAILDPEPHRLGAMISSRR
ncbi:DUF6461 domain-containing protein [Microtetraspora malaysiensis]|uniref:DUF6461 domain-containing protein n=1 Tax=Microtetraspora malaysiensis TaxID=161358 RepID=UPI001C3F15D9|nr:DUF6461 domain-containing protein [Microtetraspora malaysiensis]